MQNLTSPACGRRASARSWCLVAHLDDPCAGSWQSSCGAMCFPAWPPVAPSCSWFPSGRTSAALTLPLPRASPVSCCLPTPAPARMMRSASSRGCAKHSLLARCAAPVVAVPVLYVSAHLCCSTPPVHVCLLKCTEQALRLAHSLCGGRAAGPALAHTAHNKLPLPWGSAVQARAAAHTSFVCQPISWPDLWPAPCSARCSARCLRSSAAHLLHTRPPFPFCHDSRRRAAWTTCLQC